MTCRFLKSPASLKPAPLPVISSTAQPESTAATALLVVVFPIPISPVASREYPSSFKRCTSSIPTPIAANVSASVIAGSFKKSLVPDLIF